MTTASVAARRDIQACFRIPLKDLGETNPELRGIFTVLENARVGEDNPHAEFIADAEGYADRYASDAYWHCILQEALRACELAQPSVILDVGCGAGNSTLPLLRLFPDTQVIAGDLALPMLKILRKTLIAGGYAKRCTLVEMNADSFPLKDASCDMVCGGAILHHLYRPQDCIKEAGRVLQPGGYAMFFEPFEIGYRVFSLMVEQLLMRNSHERAKWRGDPLPKAAADFFLRWAALQDRLVRQDKRHFSLLEDKWLFTKEWLERAGTDAGLELTRLAPLHSAETMFSDHIGNLLKLETALPMDALPTWAQEFARNTDGYFSVEARRELIIEGSVVFRKRARTD